MRKQLYYYFLGLFLLLLPTLGWAKGQIIDYRVSSLGSQVKLVIELDSAFSYKIFTLSNPDRLVVDIDGARWHVPKQEVSDQAGVKGVRHGPHGNAGTRVVVDLTGKASIKNHFTLLPEQADGRYRLVVETSVANAAVAAPAVATIQPASKEEKELQVVLPAAPSTYTVVSSNDKPTMQPQLKVQETQVSNKEVVHYGAWQELEPASTAAFSVIPQPSPKPSSIPSAPRTGVARPLIVIDPGHGGVDPGTIGPAGTWEKNVTMANSLALKKILEEGGRYRVYLTRNSDYFVPLRDRVERAHEHRGDLFISLHADAHPDPRTRGLSVYTISEQAAEREAAILAERAEKEQVIRGVDLSHSSNEVANVLIDLMQRDTTNTSADFAQLVAQELGKDTKLLRNTHRFAGYRVLTGADIPSVLIELGYLSNPEEEQLLASKDYQKKLVKAIKRAIDRHFEGRRVE